MNKKSKIYVAGYKGMVGSAILRELKNQDYTNFLLKTRKELDLTNQKQVNDFFAKEKPEYVFLAAAKVGGIQANNTYRAEFIYSNICIQTNIIHASYKNKVKKLLFLGSSCIYPKLAPQPIKEDYLLTGALEPTNEPYAVAKIAGLQMCKSYRDQYNCNFISVMPTNLYGPNDNYDLENSHVLPALLRKFHEAKVNKKKEVIVWGTGKAMREFMYVDDMARACILIMQEYNNREIINIGTGEDITINQLAETIKKVVKFSGKITFDASKPDGTPRKLLDISKLKKLGFENKHSLEDGIRITYNDFLKNHN
ncbi:GDP-L-fucose synthase [Patescibacteria group bacterium]|nr:GDP-L-fucose synthase [Patescibacteria group bacterium]